MTKSLSLILAAGLLTAGTTAVVRADDRNVGAVQHRQNARIRKGVQEGDLTRREARRLRGEEAEVAEDRREALMNDGRIDRRERRHIRREQRNLNDQIHHERHDAQER